MAEDRSDLMLRMLRDIRKTLDENSEELRAIRKQAADTQESVVTALGFAAHANVQHQTVDRRLDELTARVEKLEAAR